jgi:hypothetical protein
MVYVCLQRLLRGRWKDPIDPKFIVPIWDTSFLYTGVRVFEYQLASGLRNTISAILVVVDKFLSAIPTLWRTLNMYQQSHGFGRCYKAYIVFQTAKTLLLFDNPTKDWCSGTRVDATKYTSPLLVDDRLLGNFLINTLFGLYVIPDTREESGYCVDISSDGQTSVQFFVDRLGRLRRIEINGFSATDDHELWFDIKRVCIGYAIGIVSLSYHASSHFAIESTVGILRSTCTAPSIHHILDQFACLTVPLNAVTRLEALSSRNGLDVLDERLVNLNDKRFFVHIFDHTVSRCPLTDTPFLKAYRKLCDIIYRYIDSMVPYTDFDRTVDVVSLSMLIRNQGSEIDMSGLTTEDMRRFLVECVTRCVLHGTLIHGLDVHHEVLNTLYLDHGLAPLIQRVPHLDEASIVRAIQNSRNPLLSDILTQSLIRTTQISVTRQISPLVLSVRHDTPRTEVVFQDELKAFARQNSIDVLSPRYFTRGIER